MDLYRAAGAAGGGTRRVHPGGRADRLALGRAGPAGRHLGRGRACCCDNPDAPTSTASAPPSPPADSAASHLETPGVATMLGGILLIFPGFITDLLGAAAVPAGGAPAGAARPSLASGRAGARRGRAGHRVIDLAPGEWHQLPDRRRARRRKSQSERVRSACPCREPPVLATPPTAAICAAARGRVHDDHDGNGGPRRARRSPSPDQPGAAQRPRPIHQGFLVREPERAALADSRPRRSPRSTSRSTSPSKQLADDRLRGRRSSSKARRRTAARCCSPSI